MFSMIQICDFVAAISLIAALNLVDRHYKWWLFYACTNIPFMIVTLYKDLPWLTLMGSVLMATGVKNYLAGRKKARNNDSKNSIS